ncbi:serine/threonine-protein phosphatase [Mucilaginibacter robiniae]|uniref:Serine/threonine-protein phosphatase n=1 Tax=Mucilaginibacter robiniae TaxID=2728022 RepID=A0A7L5E7T3_9SPHI|nr:PP2C family protein-serine/threonine phosphatase [Mucilaginibacter robiniae]QJD96416.1 serine/threonine-protein phosphatase [Mucilaginibacter robiniae]
MQTIEEGSGEDELIKLLLKRQWELNSLLEVTQAINKNTSAPVLIQMLEVILKNYLHIGKLRFLVERQGAFVCVSKYGGNFETVPVLYKACLQLKKVKIPTALAGHADRLLSSYSYFIPIYHKGKALAYALIGDFNLSGEMLSNDLNFIQTLINVIVVALENKKLFRERLQAERLQRELELAAEVQNMLIPVKVHKDKAVELGAKYLPHQDIGGDYFDFFRLNDQEFLWCIADVSGKGISAALLMANFQASLRAWATVDDDLSNVVRRLNTIVIKNTKGERFITLFLAKYNESTRKLTYINAGHTPSILHTGNTTLPLRAGTTMIGVFEELPFLNQGETIVDPGSLLFNYTDGLMDYELNKNDHWDEDTLIEFVKDYSHLSADKFNQVLMDHLNRIIRGRRIDDVTLLTLKFC